MNLTEDLSQYGQGITGLTGGVAANAQYAQPQQAKSLVFSFKYHALGVGGLYQKMFHAATDYFRK